MIDKYGVVVEKKPLCSICGQELDTSTTPPTCPKCGTRGIEKKSEGEETEEPEEAEATKWGWGNP